jgi:antitoxin component YwqK of YwqJK toxin-antitoxin module
MKKSFPLILILIFVMRFASAQTIRTENWPTEKGGKIRSRGAYLNDIFPLEHATKAELKNSPAPVKTGTWQYWDEKGNLRSEENYSLLGVRSGTQKTWYSDGKPESVVDLNARTAIYWHENGQKQSEGSVAADGSPRGNWIGWHSNGKINFQGNYNSDGLKTGTWRFWNELGKPLAQQTYNNGVLLN